MSTQIYRQMLIERRKAMLAALETHTDQLARKGRVADEDRPQASHEESVSVGINVLEYLQLRQIEDALERLGSGDYGVCSQCQQSIPGKRLRAVPWAKYCVQCQQAFAEQPDPEAVPLYTHYLKS